MNLRGLINIASASLTASTTYNLVVCAAPSNQRIAITGFGFYGAYNAAATPGLLQFCKAANAGSSPTATLTPFPLDPECTETFQSTWTTTPSTPPGTIVAADSRYVNPQLGLTELWDDSNFIMIKGGGFFVLQFTPGQTTNYTGWLRINE